MKSYIKDCSWMLRSRPVKFVAIGLINTAFGYSVFAILYLLSHDHRLSIACATVVGVIFNFFTTGRLVFGNADNRLIVRFVLGYLISFTANLILLELLFGLGLNPLLAQIVCLPLIVTLTYFLTARLVFRGDRS